MSIRKQYDSDLEALKTALVEMGQNAAEAVENALEALCTADTVAAQKIVQGDDRINNMERDIEHRCMTLLLRQQPVAGDLRHISTAMKVVTDIERMGDHASDIAEIIPHLVTVRREGDPAVSQAIAMGRKAYQMILDAMAAKFPNARFVLTLGSDGAVYYDGKEKVFQDIFKVKAVDTTAAGDTFTGYFIAATIEGRSIQEALRMAAKASSIAVSRPGATPSIPRADEVKKELGML